MYGTNSLEETAHGEFAAMVKTTLEQAYTMVRKLTGMHQERQKKYCDRKMHGEPFSVGDRVWLHSPVVPRSKFRKVHHP